MLRRALLLGALATLAIAAPARADDTLSLTGGVLTITHNDTDTFVEVVEDQAGNNVLFNAAGNPTRPAGCSKYTADDNSSSDRYDVSCPIAQIQSVVVNGSDANETIKAIPTRLIRFCLVGQPCLPAPPTVISLNRPFTVNGNGGDDTITGGVSNADPANVLNGGDGDDTLFGGNFNDKLDGGNGADLLRADVGNDDLVGGPGIDTVSYSGRTSANPVVATIGTSGNGTASLNENDTIHADVENLIGGDGNDTLTGNDESNAISGGLGNDTIDGKGGFDQLYGQDGNDKITAEDGNPERVDCGDGTDSDLRDTFDQMSGCESDQFTSEKQADQDHDGFAAPTDCNDNDPAINPRATDIPGDGIDQDCVNGDAVVKDVDGDGFAVPQDCDDHNPAINPNAKEIVGNDIDENCDNVAAPFQTIESNIRSSFVTSKTNTTVARLQAVALDAGVTVTATCTGGSKCPFKTAQTTTVAKATDKLDLRAKFKLKSVKPGATIKITFSRSDSISRYQTFAFRKKKLPIILTKCQRPGVAKAETCQ